MPDTFTSALLAALNASTEIDDADWQMQIPRAPSSERHLDISVREMEHENRFAATICFGMAKIRPT